MRRHYFWRSVFMFLLVIYIADKVLNFGIHVTKAMLPVLLIFFGMAVLSRGLGYGGRHRDRRYRDDYDNYQRDNFDNKYEEAYKGDNGSYDDVEKYNRFNNENNNGNNYGSAGYKHENQGNDYKYGQGSGKYYGSRKRSIVFSSSNIVADGSSGKYDIVFGDGKIDLTRLPIPVDNRSIKISVVFSNGVIRISEDVPAVIRGKGVFSSVRLPDNSMVTFGDNTYATRSFREGAPHYYINIDSVFSNTEVFEVHKS